MHLSSVHVQAPPINSVGDLGSFIRRAVRPLVAGLLLLGLLLVFGTVVQASVRRGEQLNRQMVEVPSRCDANAPQQRAPLCSTPAAAGSTALSQRRPPAAR